jgi:hypothetical protein
MGSRRIQNPIRPVHGPSPRPRSATLVSRERPVNGPQYRLTPLDPGINARANNPGDAGASGDTSLNSRARPFPAQPVIAPSFTMGSRRSQNPIRPVHGPSPRPRSATLVSRERPVNGPQYRLTPLDPGINARANIPGDAGASGAHCSTSARTVPRAAGHSPIVHDGVMPRPKPHQARSRVFPFVAVTRHDPSTSSARSNRSCTDPFA